jgi:pilus assembly protein CpaB
LRVLAVDQTAGTDKTQPVVVRAVTLEMSATEAEALVKAQTEGKLQLALRNPLNLEKKSPAVEPAPVAPAMAVASAEAPKRVIQRSNGGGGGITVIRGTEAKLVNIR